MELVRKVEQGDLGGQNRLVCGDNLALMRSLGDECLDLVYIDPPFFSGRNYRSTQAPEGFGDVWEGGIEGYLAFLEPRLAEVRRLLKPTGLVYVHLDWHAVHYVKCQLDRLFGMECFVNEVIWSYRSGGGSKRHFGRKHDTLLLYAKDARGYRFYPDAVRVPYDAVIAESRREAFHPDGKVCSDVWDIGRPPNHSKEWLGYPTQKPEALLERVLLSATQPGDWVADFFVGSGTTVAVAERLGRRWIGCDVSAAALEVTRGRLERAEAACFMVEEA